MAYADATTRLGLYGASRRQYVGFTAREPFVIVGGGLIVFRYEWTWDRYWE